MKVLPDGARCVTVSSDRTARLWNLGTAENLAVLGGHSAIVIALDVTTGSEAYLAWLVDSVSA